MRLFGRRKYASVTAVDRTSIRVIEPAGEETTIDIAVLSWLSFLQVGDETQYVYEGWWLLGKANACTAVRIECGTIDSLLRDGALAESAGRIEDKTIIFTSSRPTRLSERTAQYGVVHMNAHEATELRNTSTQKRVASINDFPKIL